MCWQPKPPDAQDVYGDCTPGHGYECCPGLACVKVSAYFSQCCVGPDDPVGCGVTTWRREIPALPQRGQQNQQNQQDYGRPQRTQHWPSFLPSSSLLASEDQACGVQYVYAGENYATDALGQTLPEAIDECNVQNFDGYYTSNCTAPPAASKVCHGSMVLVRYPEYNTQQYECQ